MSKTKGKRGPEKGYGATSRGPLHDLLSAKLPDLRDRASGICQLHVLAAHLDMTRGGVMEWLRADGPNRISTPGAVKVVELSERQTTGGPGFVPLTLNDLRPFMGRWTR